MRSAREAARAIRDEYLQLPGLRLTREQVQRLYSLDTITCEAILNAFVDLRFLARTADGRYLRHPTALSRRLDAPAQAA